MRDPIIRHITIGATLGCVVGSASLVWIPSFLLRTHGMNIAGVGVYLAVLVGIGGAFGTWLAGATSDRLRKRDIRWSLWLIGLILLAVKPLAFGFLLIDDTTIALALFVLPAICGAAYVGTSMRFCITAFQPNSGLWPQPCFCSLSILSDAGSAHCWSAH